MHFQQSITFSGGTDPILDVFPPDYKMFVLRVGTGVDIDYIILSETGLQWEIGVGQLAVGGAFTRDTVTENSLGTFVKVDFNLGRHTVIVQEQSAGGLSDGDYGDVTVSGSGTVLTLDMTEAPYDNSTSGLTATDVQDAIDELVPQVEVVELSRLMSVRAVVMAVWRCRLTSEPSRCHRPLWAAFAPILLLAVTVENITASTKSLMTGQVAVRNAVSELRLLTASVFRAGSPEKVALVGHTGIMGTGTPQEAHPHTAQLIPPATLLGGL